MLIHLPLPSSEQFLLTVNADRVINLPHTLTGDVALHVNSLLWVSILKTKLRPEGPKKIYPVDCSRR